MLSLTRKADYALSALAELARRGNSIASARDLSNSLHIPLRALTNTLNLLGRRGLVVSVRGSNGGYGLARNPREITLVELFDAVEGPMRFARCCSNTPDLGNQRCDLEDSCEIRDPVRKLHTALRSFLSQVTVDDMAWNRVRLTGTGLLAGA